VDDVGIVAVIALLAGVGAGGEGLGIGDEVHDRMIQRERAMVRDKPRRDHRDGHHHEGGDCSTHWATCLST